MSSGKVRYLRALYEFRALSPQRAVSSNRVAKRLGVRAPTAVVMLRRLARRGLVEYEPRHGAWLTRKGIRAMRRQAWRHRVLEVFLFKELGFEREKAHRYAEAIEDAVPEEVIMKLCARLNHPQRCPCGKRIVCHCSGDGSP